MVQSAIKKILEQALTELGLGTVEFSVARPADLAHGDYASNVAMLLARKTDEPAPALAKKIADQLKTRPWLDHVAVAPPGFINFYLTPEFFAAELKKILASGNDYGRGEKLAGQKVLIEYTDPNPFKEFHLGHLMSNTIGEALARLLEWQGAEVKRVCYQGDVGLHVAKALWAKSKVNPPAGRAGGQKSKVKEWGEAYAYGAQTYESDEAGKREINELNKKIYDRGDPEINDLYEAGKKICLDDFEIIYRRLGTKFDHYFFESESGPVGKELVAQNRGRVFEESDGAIVFHGEKRDPGLHTRVFITKDGLPTYEAKELGLTKLKNDFWPHDLSLVLTGNEVVEYFKVVLAAMREVLPAAAVKIRHLAHGMLRLPTGKMSSRTGTVITAEDLILETGKKILDRLATATLPEDEKGGIAESVALGAIKYSILKQAPGRDIIFDPGKSLSLEGDSGPYLQYAVVRARAVLMKARAANLSSDPSPSETGDCELARLLQRFPEAAARAAENYAPNLLVTYLISLAASFNRFYARETIVDETAPDVSRYRLALTQAAATVLANGLSLLAIPIPEKM